MKTGKLFKIFIVMVGIGMLATACGGSGDDVSIVIPGSRIPDSPNTASTIPSTDTSSSLATQPASTTTSTTPPPETTTTTNAVAPVVTTVTTPPVETTMVTATPYEFASCMWDFLDGDVETPDDDKYEWRCTLRKWDIEEYEENIFALRCDVRSVATSVGTTRELRGEDTCEGKSPAAGELNEISEILEERYENG